MIIAEHDDVIEYQYRNEDGSLHRVDGPAIEWVDGSLEYWVDGIRHRLDGPAVIWSNGYEAWYKDGQLLREDGPKVLRRPGSSNDEVFSIDQCGIQCDICDASIKLMENVFHYTGYLHGVLNTHIHLCEPCFDSKVKFPLIDFTREETCANET